MHGRNGEWGFGGGVRVTGYGLRVMRSDGWRGSASFGRGLSIRQSLSRGDRVAPSKGFAVHLRAPAWDAQLEDVEERAFRLSEANRKRYGGFLLLLQTPEGEFLTVVDDGSGRTMVGAVLARSMPMSPTAR